MNRLISFLGLCSLVHSRTVINVQEKGMIEEVNTLAIAQANAVIFNQILQNVVPDSVIFFPNFTFHMGGGIYGTGLRNVTIQLDGTISFNDDRDAWPKNSNGLVQMCIYLEDAEDLIITSLGKGTIQGNGAKWWGYINYLVHKEDRPRLLEIHNSARILVENIAMIDSPYWTFWAHDITDLEIHHCDISARRSNVDKHDINNLGAFNTDGFDIAGSNVYIHDVTVWNDDDTICIKDSAKDGKRAICSENILIERAAVSGVGLTIGSIGSGPNHNCVRNVTFRDVSMHNPFKGIYIKSRPDGQGTGEISNVLYENVVIDNPSQWAIWIGPQQAIYASACSLGWPFVPFTKCPVPSRVTMSQITLRNITINNPAWSPGVVIGNETNPMVDIIFEDVVVNHKGLNGLLPFGLDFYKCENVQNGHSVGKTNPVPKCFASAKAKAAQY